MTQVKTLSVFAFALVVASVASATSRPAVSREQAAHIVASFNRDAGLQKEIENGQRHIESFTTPDGTRAILVTSHFDKSSNRLIAFADPSFARTCVERYALHPDQDRVVALSESDCWDRDTYGGM